MNPHQLKRLFPHASKSVLAANSGDYGAGKPEAVIPVKDSRKAAESERAVKGEGQQLAGCIEAKKGSPGRLHLKFISVRKRACDPDNLVPKWTIDCLRYCGIIKDDTSEHITLETTQQKCCKGEEEHTVLEVYELP